MADYTEKACTIHFQGGAFTSGGAAIVGDRALLYAYPADGKVGNWHGDQKVPALYGRVWVSNMGDTRQHVTFTWAGRRYSGTYYKSAGDLVRARAWKRVKPHI